MLLILIMVIISKKLFRYFLGDLGDLNNVDMTKKEALKKHKDLLAILTYYIISYTLIAISIVTAKTIFLIIPILMFFLMIPVNEIYEKRFQKIQRSVKEYYKDLIICNMLKKNARQIIYLIVFACGVRLIYLSFYAKDNWINIFSGVGTGLLTSLVVSVIINA
ncbi:hypothetical protein [Sedimentibacter sp. LTW-03]|uniref:hypothetical protein n=1 Tax=Sedimentibacter sp. LTW-03 TaxID=3453406 RepID=UPI003F86FB9D